MSTWSWGGYAVGYHGYPRTTNDLDIWVKRTAENAARLVDSLREFGFDTSDLSDELFLRPNAIVRLGTPPVRIEIFTDVSGVEFEDCRPRAIEDEIDGVTTPIISLQDPSLLVALVFLPVAAARAVGPRSPRIERIAATGEGGYVRLGGRLPRRLQETVA